MLRNEVIASTFVIGEMERCMIFVLPFSFITVKMEKETFIKEKEHGL